MMEVFNNQIHNNTIKTKLVYIVGRGHSGSTLLELLLNRHSQIASMGELDLFSLQIYRDEKTKWVGRCSCGRRPYNCKIWSNIINDINKKYQVDLMKNPFNWRLSDVGLYEEMDNPGITEFLRYKYHRLVRTIFYSYFKKLPVFINAVYREWVQRRDYVAMQYAKINNAKAVVDASKDQLHMRDIDNYSELDVKIIYLTRDVRGNVWSAKKRNNINTVKEANDWAKLNKKILRYLKFVDTEKYIHIKYEDLCKDPAGELHKLHKFIGVTPEYVYDKREFLDRHTIAGNKIRFKEIDKIQQDLGWTTNLKEVDLANINKCAGHIARSLGYDIK